MRPQKILPLLILTMCSLGLRAQNNSGIPTELEYYQPYYAMSTNYFSVGLGLAIPVGQYGASPSADLPLLAPFAGQDGMGGRGGFGLGLEYTGRFVSFKKQKRRNELEYKDEIYPIVKLRLEYLSLGNIDWSEVIPNSYSNGRINIISNSLGYGFAKNIDQRYVFEFVANVSSVLHQSPNLYLDPDQIRITRDYNVYNADNDPNADFDDKMGMSFGYGLSAYLRHKDWRFGLVYQSIFVWDQTFQVSAADTRSAIISEFQISTLQLNFSYCL